MPVKGYHQTAEHRAKLAQRAKGRKRTPATRTKLRAAANAQWRRMTQAERTARADAMRLQREWEAAHDPSANARRVYRPDLPRLYPTSLRIGPDNRCESGRPRMRIDQYLERWIAAHRVDFPSLDGCWNMEQLISSRKAYNRMRQLAGLRQQWGLYVCARIDLLHASNPLPYRLVQLDRSHLDLTRWLLKQGRITTTRFDIFFQRFHWWEIVPLEQYVPDDSEPTPPALPVRVIQETAHE
jgi:hypothetical protein